MSDEMTITVSMARKINMGNFESADVFVSISGIKEGMSLMDIEPLLVAGRFGWEAAREALVEQIRITREKRARE
jgi:hypothetical protein